MAVVLLALGLALGTLSDDAEADPPLAFVLPPPSSFPMVCTPAACEWPEIAPFGGPFEPGTVFLSDESARIWWMDETVLPMPDIFEFTAAIAGTPEPQLAALAFTFGRRRHADPHALYMLTPRLAPLGQQLCSEAWLDMDGLSDQRLGKLNAEGWAFFPGAPTVTCSGYARERLVAAERVSPYVVDVDPDLDPETRLFVTATENTGIPRTVLLEIDQATGAVVDTIPLDPPNTGIRAMDFNRAGELFAATCDISVDPVSGLARCQFDAISEIDIFTGDVVQELFLHDPVGFDGPYDIADLVVYPGPFIWVADRGNPAAGVDPSVRRYAPGFPAVDVVTFTTGFPVALDLDGRGNVVVLVDDGWGIEGIFRVSRAIVDDPLAVLPLVDPPIETQNFGPIASLRDLAISYTPEDCANPDGWDNDNDGFVDEHCPMETDPEDPDPDEGDPEIMCPPFCPTPPPVPRPFPGTEKCTDDPAACVVGLVDVEAKEVRDAFPARSYHPLVAKFRRTLRESGPEPPPTKVVTTRVGLLDTVTITVPPEYAHVFPRGIDIVATEFKGFLTGPNVQADIRINQARIIRRLTDLPTGEVLTLFFSPQIQAAHLFVVFTEYRADVSGALIRPPFEITMTGGRTKHPTESFDRDHDGLVDSFERSIGLLPTSADTDGDGVTDPYDNCPAFPNPAQTDADGDESGDECDLIGVETDFDPDTLNPRSHGSFVTVHLEPPIAFFAEDIDLSSVFLTSTDGLARVPAVSDPSFGFVSDPAGYLTDIDGDGILERMVKFERCRVAEVLDRGPAIEIVVGGLVAGFDIEGRDVIRVKEGTASCD